MSYGLALSGGALRGAAHIGLLEVFLENKLVPKMLAGSSAGSIVGCLYAAGMKPQTMLTLVNQIQKLLPKNGEELIRPHILVPSAQLAGWLPQGFLSSQFIETIMNKLLGKKSFEQLTRPMAVTASDLHTGELIIFTAEKLIPKKPWPNNIQFQSRVPVAEAIRASCAIPGVFTPKIIGQRTLVDGGVVDNVPADVLRLMGASKIVAVDLGFAVQQSEPLKHVLDILLQTYDIMGQRISSLVVEKHADLVIHPQTGGAGLLDFPKIPTFVESGRTAGRENLASVKQLLS
ncbi:MAG TPA: patatin-like phospholipase family protein [Clostridia bacterium]|nr:patatin-like phospholipase family protein [Clostridia bacterium]